MLWNSLGLLPLIPNYSWPLNIGFNCTGPLIRGLFSINTFTFWSVVGSLNAKDQLHALISAILYDKLAHPQILGPNPSDTEGKLSFEGIMSSMWISDHQEWELERAPSPPHPGCCRFDCTELKSKLFNSFQLLWNQCQY